MMMMQSTEEERYIALTNRKLTVCMWDSTKEIHFFHPEETIAQALVRHANELQIVGSVVSFESLEEPVKITIDTIKDSMAAMKKQHANLLNLSKLFTIIHQVTQHAVLLEVNSCRQMYNKSKNKNMTENIYRYISAFYDQTYLYPVIISAKECSKQQDDNAHMVVNVGEIPLTVLNVIQKESALSIPQWLLQSREDSDFGSTPSFTIILPQLVKIFNEKEAILIRQFPDRMLSEKQQRIKKKLIRFEKGKEFLKRIFFISWS